MPSLFASWFARDDAAVSPDDHLDHPGGAALEPNAPSTSPNSGWLWSATIAVGLLVLVVGVAGVKSWSDLRISQTRADELRIDVEHSSDSVALLRQRIHLLQSDSELLERVAREELGVVHPDEIVVILPDV